MDTNGFLINRYAQGKRGESKGWDIVADMSQSDIERFIFECHKQNTPPTFEQAFMYILRLVTAHALVNNG